MEINYLKTVIIRQIKKIIERFPRLFSIIKFIKDNNLLYKEALLTPMGFRFIGNRDMQNGIFEPEETKLIIKLLEKVEVVINVGANIGYYCCIALSNNKYVIAFEPISLNIKYLMKNIKSNNWENNIEVYPIALSDRVKVIEMYGSGTGASLIKGWAGISEKDFSLVPSSTLDIILGSRFANIRCLIIVDIEGSEYDMLKGATFMIKNEPKPVWMVEITVSEHQPKGVYVNPNLLKTFELFWENGYESWTVGKDFKKITHFDIKETINSGLSTFINHNFIFIEKAKGMNLINNGN